MTTRVVVSRAQLRDYGIAVLGVALVTLLRLPLEGALHGRAPYALYYIPILLTAWCCGVGPTLLAITLSLASSWAFVVPQSEPGYMATVAVFLAVCSAMAWMARSARQLSGSRERLAAIVQFSEDAIVTKNLDGVIESWNAGAERLFGYSAAEVVGRPVSIIIPPEHQDEETQILARLRRGERIDHFETIRVAKGGRRVDVSLTISPLRDGFGTIVGASKVARDITERRRMTEALAAQREWLDRTLQSIGDAVIATDALGQVAFMNPVAEHLTGWLTAEAKGHACEDVFRIVNEKTRHAVESPVRRVLREGTIVGLANSTVLIAADGVERPIDDSGAPIRGGEGQIVGVVLVFRDISDRHQAESERRAATIERDRLLESERVARNEAEHANRAKDEFVAMVSHELRTPLNAIIGWAHILATSPGDPEALRRGVDVIARNARAQEQLISDLLDMSRIISGKLRLDVHEIDLIAIIRAAIETTKPATDAKGIAIECVLDPSVALTSGDAERIQQCIWNLLSNAIKFTQQGGRVVVTLGRSDSHLEITVADNGAGIRHEFLPLVFERFRQAEGPSTRRGGLGLGLAIVKELIELHGGRVYVESPGEGQGATFRLSLPVRALRASPAPTAVEPEPSTSLTHVRVLLIEDDTDNRDILRTLLEQHDAKVFATGSPHEALELMAVARPNFLISDIGLPEMDGYELIRRLRLMEEDTATRIPAIALTAHAGLEDRTRALRAGYQAHIAKPVEPTELVATIESLAELGAVKDSERVGR